MPASKPADPATVDGAHALAPVNCWLINEGSGQPGDIGTSALSISGGDTPIWSTESGFGDIAQFDGAKHVEYGVTAALAGLSKFTVVLSIRPTTFAQNCAFLQKKAAWNSKNIFSMGLHTGAGIGDYIYLEIGKTSAIAVHYAKYTNFTAYNDTTKQHQWIMGYDGSRAAEDRVNFWYDSILAPHTPAANGTVRGDDSAVSVVSEATEVIRLCEGAGWTDPIGEFDGDLGYIYIIPNVFPTQQQVTDLFAHPYQFVTGVKPVAFFFLNPGDQTITIKDNAKLSYVEAARASRTGRVPAQVTFRRVGDEASPLTVVFSKSSSAAQGSLVEGTDYEPIGTTLVIPAAANNANLAVNPLRRPTERAGFAHMTLAVDADAAYDIGIPATIDVRINEAQLDKYGGDARIGRQPVTRFSPDGTPKFDVKRVNGQWMFITPEGNGMYLKAIYQILADTPTRGAETSAKILAKYGGVGGQFTHQYIRQMKKVGFNSEGGFSSITAYPNELASSLNVDDVDKVPFITMQQVTTFGLRSAQFASVAGEIGSGTDPATSVINGNLIGVAFRGFPDVFNPHYTVYCNNVVATSGDGLSPGGNVGLQNSPWCIMARMDDGDATYGLANAAGPRGAALGVKIHNHLGFITLCGKPTRSSIAWSGFHGRYIDPWSYAKLHLRDSMITKYGTIGALNTAWGSSYTTFQSSNQSVVGEQLLWQEGTAAITDAQGDGARTVFDTLCALRYIPMAQSDLQNTVKLYVNGVEVGTDDGAGNITGATIASGTIDYYTGIINVTFNDPVTNTHLLSVDYTGNDWALGGTGFMDEDGTSAYLGTNLAVRTNELVGVPANTQTDLDDFLTDLFDGYFRIFSGAIRKALPGTLVTGPATMFAGARDQGLIAAGKYLDVVDESTTMKQEVSALFVGDYALHGKPIFSWYTIDLADDNDLRQFRAAGITLSGTSGAITVTADADVFTSSDGNKTLGVPGGGVMGITYVSPTVITGTTKIDFGTTSYAQNAWFTGPECWGLADIAEVEASRSYTVKDQPDRGARHIWAQNDLLGLVGSGGDKFYIGIDWWESLHTQSSNEYHAFALFTNNGNAFDGVEAIQAAGTDMWGYATGGEDNDLGDAMKGISEGNALPGKLISVGKAFL